MPNRETHRFLILSWRVTQFLTLVLQCPTFLWPSGPTEDCATVYPIWILVAIKFCQNWNLNLNDFDIIIVVSKVLFQKKLNSKNRFCQERPNFVAKFLVLSKSDGNQKPNSIHCGLQPAAQPVTANKITRPPSPLIAFLLCFLAGFFCKLSGDSATACHCQTMAGPSEGLKIRRCQ